MKRADDFTREGGVRTGVLRRQTSKAHGVLRALATEIALVLIYGYRAVVAPQLAGACRFYPSCSRYAEEAITRFGPWRGTGLALRRLSRCHPFHPGGWDPVPEALPLRPPGKGG